MSDSTDITVPDLGDFSDVEVIEILVAEGDEVAREDGLITLETDKATMDIPSPHDGVIESISVSTGDRVSSGDTIGRMTTRDGNKDDAGNDGNDDDDAAGNGEKDDAPADARSDAANGEPDKAESQDDDAGPDADAESASSGEEPSDGDARSGGEQTTVVVPDIGDFSDVDVIEVLVSEGDRVDVEDPLITLETDKAAMDVPSTAAGTVSKLLVKAGDKVSAGSDVLVIEAAAEDGKAPSPAVQQKESKGDADRKENDDRDSKASRPASRRSGSSEDRGSATPSGDTGSAGKLPPIDEAGFSRAHASPSVRKLARELGVDLVRVKGSGPKRRILHDDVKAFVKAALSGSGGGDAGGALPKVPSVDFAKFGEVDPQPLTRIQKIAGPRLQASWINLPHVTQHDLADITDLEARRQELKGAAKERGISLTPLAFVMKACVAALREFPKANASLSNDQASLVYKKYIHLGFAADTENGLVVPVVRNADQMDIYEIAQQLGELSSKAREGKLKADQMQGASFTVSSLGSIGGTAFTPIVNAPEVAILGVSRASMQPVWDGETFRPRLMLPLSLSYDHRVIDGAYAVRITTFLAGALADVDKLLEAIP